MADAGADVEAGPGIHASAVVVRGGNRMVKVSVPLQAYHRDGQVAYEATATAFVVIPASGPIPNLIPLGTATAEVLNA